MKRILLLLTLTLSANAFALPPEDCKKLVAFKVNQQAKLSLSRYGLGLISAATLEAQKEEQRQQGQEAMRKCEVSDAQA